MKLTLRDVAEDAVTELIFDPRDPDLARGGGLRSGRYRIDGENTLELDGVAFVPGVTLTGRVSGLLHTPAARPAYGSAAGPRRTACSRSAANG